MLTQQFLFILSSRTPFSGVHPTVIGFSLSLSQLMKQQGDFIYFAECVRKEVVNGCEWKDSESFFWKSFIAGKGELQFLTLRIMFALVQGENDSQGITSY